MARGLDKPTADTLRVAVSIVLQQAKPPSPNLSFHQRRTIWDLRGVETIVILPADKGRATVVMNSDDYNRKTEEIRNDDKYRPLGWDPTLTIEKKVTKSLKLLHSDGYISDKLLDQLTPPVTKTHPRCTDSLRSTRRAYQWDPLSQPSVLQHTAWLRSSPGFWPPTHWQELLHSQELCPVCDQPTGCPHQSHKVVERRLSDQTLIERTTPVQQLVHLTELCLHSTYFKCQSKFYKQTDGAAMGSPLSPIIANLFMEQLEEEAIQ